MTRYDDFIEYLEENEMSANTIACYSQAVKQFFDNYSELTKKNLLQFKKMLSDKWKPKTVSIRIIAMNRYAEFVGKTDCKVKTQKTQKKFYLENVPDDDEYNTLLAYFKEHNLKYYWIVRYLAGTGVRISELVRLKGKCLKLGYADMHSKGKERRILIPKNLIEESLSFFGNIADEEPLFKSHQRPTSAITTRGVELSLKKIGMRAGVRKEVLHPHAFRHYFAIKMLKATNNDISLISSYLGHSSVEMTAIYTMRSLKEQVNFMSQAMTW